MKVTEFNFKPEFINILITHLDAKSLRPVYNINPNAKYTVDNIIEIIAAISQKCYTRYRLPGDLARYFKESEYSKFSRTSLKTLVKNQFLTTTDNSFFNTYVVIGYDVPITIKEMVVVC
jgi:hypothetical protein